MVKNLGETSLAPKQISLNLFGDKFELLPNGVIIHGSPTASEYDEAFRRLTIIESATSWWYGDLVNGRERDYGSLKETSEKLELNFQYVANCAWVASRYEVSSREETLTFKHYAIAAALDDRLEWLKKAKDEGWTTRQLKLSILEASIEKPNFDGPPPLICKEDYHLWLPKQPDCDLLLTDPPYSTDISLSIEEFAKWLPTALSKVKPSGHAYIFIGPYPREVRAYLNLLDHHIDLTQLLVWEYRNTMGPSPIHEYKSNWQAIIYYHGPTAEPLQCDLLLEKYAVHEFSMPRGGVSHATWEKPAGLAERFIRHSTKPGDIVIDCFAGTGAFLATAAKFGRVAFGCDVDPDMIKLAQKRGCEIG